MQENPEKKQLDLYGETILRESRSPYHFEKMPEGQTAVEAYNPYCGDKYRLFPEVEEGVIRAIHFHGYGCAVSKASCSVLARELEGKPVEEARALIEGFVAAIRREAIPSDRVALFAAPFLPAADYPGRETCAVLGWEALGRWLEVDDGPARHSF
ncbi:MAG TPA: iron-sulfur cluster assembly scaffold protein [Flavilitoribacter sp.]|nr:iron-sulfur cluster assembly scaffold protein [Flavilitoribacter sp.]HMQ89446.1 iron-sulfur cluster assembly scaffold protein [Flavilitoribacter sp.]